MKTTNYEFKQISEKKLCKYVKYKKDKNKLDYCSGYFYSKNGFLLLYCLDFYSDHML